MLSFMVEGQGAYIRVFEVRKTVLRGTCCFHCIANVCREKDKCLVRLSDPNVDLAADRDSLNANGNKFGCFGRKHAMYLTR